LRTRGEAKAQRDGVDAFVWLPLLGSCGQSASAMLAQTLFLFVFAANGFFAGIIEERSTVRFRIFSVPRM
jgi:hypothetical protein